MFYDCLLTTAPTLEGYHIVEQCGIVYGETVFRHGFTARLGAGLANLADSFSLRSKEMSGSVSLIESARAFAYEKMIAEAKQRGANAIIAIDTDNTIGDEIMYLSLYGTAVKVVSEEEYKKRLQAEKDARKWQEKAAEERKSSIGKQADASIIGGQYKSISDVATALRSAHIEYSIVKFYGGLAIESSPTVDEYIEKHPNVRLSKDDMYNKIVWVFR